MKVTVFVISFSLLSAVVCAQQENHSDTLTQLYIEGDYTTIKEIVTETLRNGAETKETWFFYGKALEALYDFDSASVCYEKALKFDSADLKILNSLASSYVDKRNFNRAGDIYRKILAINPQRTDAKINLANLFLRMDRDIQAKELFNELVNNDTANTYFLSQVAVCYHNLNVIDSAIYYFEKAVRLNPEDYLTVTRLSNLYVRHGTVKNGLLITDRYLQYDSSNVQVLRLNAYMHFLSGDYGKAVSQYLKCMANGDSSFLAMKFLGLSYHQNEDMYMAATYLDKAYRQDTTDMETCLYLGISVGWTMDKQKGIGYLKKVLTMIFPADELVVRVYRELGDLYMAWSKPGEAIPYYMRILDYGTDNRLVLYKLGSSYEYIDKEKALDWYNEFMKTRDPDAQRVATNAEGFMVVSYYDLAERKISELKKELFFEGKLEKE